LKVSLHEKFETLPLKEVAKKKSNWIIINSDPKNLYEFLTPVSVYAYGGSFPRFNFKNFHIEQVKRPFFTLIKT